jgi:MFS family permease
VHSGFYGWKLVVALWVVLGINLAFPLYGLSFLNVHMADQFGFSRTVLGITYALFMAMTGLPGPLVARLIDRIGIRNTMAVGNLLLAMAAAAMATFVSSPLMLLVVGGLVLGLSDAVGGPIPAQASITFWFVRRRSLALAVVLSGGTIGGIVSAPLLEHIVASAGGDWRLGWWLIAALGLVAVAVSLIFVRNRPEDIGQRPDGGSGTAAAAAKEPAVAPTSRRVHITGENWTFAEVVRTPSFWLVMLCALGFSSAYVIFLAQGALQIRDLGYSLETAAYLLSAAVAVGLVAHLVTGYLGDRIDPQYIWVVAMACQGAGIALFARASEPWLLYASVALLGVGGSSSMVCQVTLLGNWFGARAYAAVFGLASAVQSTLGAAAPVLAGLYFDRFGTFAPVLYGVGIACAAGALLMSTLRPPSRAGTAPARASPTA